MNVLGVELTADMEWEDVTQVCAPRDEGLAFTEIRNRFRGKDEFAFGQAEGYMSEFKRGVSGLESLRCH